MPRVSDAMSTGFTAADVKSLHDPLPAEFPDNRLLNRVPEALASLSLMIA